MRRSLLFSIALTLSCTSASSEPDASAPVDAPADAYVEPWAPPPQCATIGSGDPSTGVRVSGNAFSFTLSGGRIEDAYVTSLEHPEWCVRTGAEGAFELLGVPVGSDLTLRVHHPDYVVVQTGTHTVPAEGMDRLTFQVPDHSIYDLLARVVRVRPDPDHCQIAATVTEIGRSLYTTDWPSHGQAGATVSIGPTPAEADGPIYFQYYETGILPDRTLTETSRDGGILYLNVTPGEYVLSAQAAGTSFRDVRVRCEPGVLVNPSPPWSLQAY